MKAILLAAGRGTRISRMIEELPKCTMPIDGIPLIRYSVEMLLDAGLEIVVCVGFKAEKIYDALEGLPVKYYFNPFFEITNSIASLWFAKEEIADMHDELILLNADVFFSETMLHRLINNGFDACVLSDKTRTDLGDYFFETTDDGCIEKYGKDLPFVKRSCEYVGMAKISKHFTMSFYNRLNQLLKDQQYDLWWENVLYSFAGSEKKINTIDVEGEFWAEVDYFDDYERVLRHIERSRQSGIEIGL